MKANNLTVCIDAPCNLACSYCISKMTFAPKPDCDTFYWNINKVRKIATMAGVTGVLITSKGEPLLNMDQVVFVMKKFKWFPLEIQTNGILLNMDNLSKLYEYKINTIAVSLNTLDIDNKLKDTFEMMSKFDIVSRVTLVLTDTFKDSTFNEILEFCSNNKIKQLTLRKATLPAKIITGYEADETRQWIRQNTAYNYPKIFNELEKYMTNFNLIRSLPWGALVYDVNGLAVTTIDYCIQSSNNTDDIRSLIYHQDGHLYTSWDKQSSIIF